MMKQACRMSVIKIKKRLASANHKKHATLTQRTMNRAIEEEDRSNSRS